jgi:hypothetical protein
MTKHQAFLLDALLGVPACLAGVWLLGRLGVGESVLLKRIENDEDSGDGGDPRAG